MRFLVDCLYPEAASPSIACEHSTTNCPDGSYRSMNNCLQCSPGSYGQGSLLRSTLCSGPCNPGRFGSEAGQTSPLCTAACPPGYFCPGGMVSGTANVSSSGATEVPVFLCFTHTSVTACNNHCGSPAGVQTCTAQRGQGSKQAFQ